MDVVFSLGVGQRPTWERLISGWSGVTRLPDNIVPGNPATAASVVPLTHDDPDSFDISLVADIRTVRRGTVSSGLPSKPVVAEILGLSLDILNVEGGAIAHGHLIDAIGAVLLTRQKHSIRRDGLRRGSISLYIGGGQGVAVAIDVT